MKQNHFSVKAAALVVIAALVAAIMACSTLAEAGSAGAQLAAQAGLISQDVADITSSGLSTYAESAKAAENLTPENEYYIGRAVAANIATQYPVYTREPALTAYLNKICDAITINSPKPFLFTPENAPAGSTGYFVEILDTMEINALSTPGGHIFVTRGLLACAASEDAAASVIAHEVAHIQLQHGLKAIRSSRYVNAVLSGAVASLGTAGGANVKELADAMGAGVGDMLGTMVNKGFSKDNEYEADTLALSLLASAGYRPSSILDMLHSLEQNEKPNQGFGKTHPSPKDRITNVNKSLGKYNVPDTTEYRRKRYAAVTPR